MRRFGSFVLAMAVVALVAVSAQAQDQPQRKGAGGRGMMGMGGGMAGAALLTNESVQKELKLDAGQIEKVKKIAADQGAKAREQLQGLRDLSPEQRREKLESFQQTARRETFQALREGDTLKPEQARRFMQIDLQVRGVSALNSPFIAQRLNLTDDQKAKIKAIVDEQPAKMREIFQGASSDRAGAMEKITALRKEANDKALAVLTAEQKDNYKKMLGEPFKLVVQPRRPAAG